MSSGKSLLIPQGYTERHQQLAGSSSLIRSFKSQPKNHIRSEIKTHVYKAWYLIQSFCRKWTLICVSQLCCQCRNLCRVLPDQLLFLEAFWIKGFSPCQAHLDIFPFTWRYKGPLGPVTLLIDCNIALMHFLCSRCQTVPESCKLRINSMHRLFSTFI